MSGLCRYAQRDEHGKNRSKENLESIAKSPEHPGLTPFARLLEDLPKSPATWAITGVAGFIGSNLLETLLRAGQTVRGLDNFVTGKKKNLEEVKGQVTAAQWSRFAFVEGDICDDSVCREFCRGVDYLLHQAAIGSVPRSIADPAATHLTNVDGFLKMLMGARDARVKRFVYASSSAVYGDHPSLPKVEQNIGTALSPYAVSKRVNELYAGVFARCYGLETIGLRYFNVFGQRQDPEGEYAAVIPRWIAALLKNQTIYINGDGETSRDFCHVSNVVEANLLAATTDQPEAINRVYNVALNERTTLNELFLQLRDRLAATQPGLRKAEPVYRDFQAGDVRHSQADISQARQLLGYCPQCKIGDGLDRSLAWYHSHLS